MNGSKNHFFHFYRWFDRLILFFIISNSFILAIYDYSEKMKSFNKTLQIIGDFLSAAFLFEALIKILGMGFIFHKNSYLRDPWNALDFLIVLIG